MGLLTFLYSVLAFWVFTHLVNHLYQRQRRRRQRPSLPIYASHRASPATFNLVLKPFHLIIDTTIFNPVHDTFAAYLYNQPLLKNALRRFYDIGNSFAVLGMTGALGLLTWTTIKLLYLLFQESMNPAPVSPFSKRGSTVVSREGIDLPFHLIIPGVTAPFNHLPILLIALFVGQITHELGHAITAALESVTLTSAGTSVFIILPSAFVSLSSGTLQRLRPIGRLRIVSGGAFHNLFAWSLLFLLGCTGIDSAILSFGYKDASTQGKVVISVDNDSPLTEHIPVGAVITKLNDFPLRIPINPEHDSDGDLWSRYFFEPNIIPESNFGWCVEQDWFSTQDQKCCSSQPRNDNGVVCFSASKNATEAGHCIDPVPLLTDLNDSKRPIAPENLLRITFRYEDSEKIILWSGPPMEVWEQVEVGNLLPRTFLSPILLPRILENYFMYLKIVMLSLYFVNLLPLPFLDGDQLLAVITELIFTEAGTKGQDLETAERGFRSWSTRSDGGPQRRKHLMKTGIQVFTRALVLLSSFLSLLRWYQS